MYEKGRQNMRQGQKLVQDVNYSYEILFSMMSALESVVNCARGVDPKSYYASKMFGAYDRVDFSRKTYSELLSQLQIQIILCKNSRMMMKMENPDYVWELPVNFSEKYAVSVVEGYIRALEEQKDTKDALNLAKDVLKIIRGEFNHPLSAEKLQITHSQAKRDNQ
jgi:hypothetical protein